LKVLVVSDTHGDIVGLKKIIMTQQKAEVVIHLGDAQEDLEPVVRSFPEKSFYLVKGNCDLGIDLPYYGILSLEGHRIFYTHGHLYGVKYGTERLIEAASENECDIALYGHTHEADNHYEDGIYVMNPGSSRGYYATYGTIELIKGSVLTNIANVI
jgi:putative phosphoesterase